MTKKQISLGIGTVLIIVIVIAIILYLRNRGVDTYATYNGAIVTTTTENTSPETNESNLERVSPSGTTPLEIIDIPTTGFPPENPPEIVGTNSTGTDINTVVDSDSDTIPDTEEARYGTDPNKADTDGDGYTDADEIKNGYNPLGEGRCAVSTCIINE